jgi:hypothetical protein
MQRPRVKDKHQPGGVVAGFNPEKSVGMNCGKTDGAEEKNYSE